MKLPNGWAKSILHHLAYVQTGLSKSENRQGPSVKRPYLRVANVQDGYIDLSEMKEIDVPIGQVERFTLQKDDLVLTEGGDFDKLGRGCIWHGEIPDCVHQNHIFAVRILDKKVLEPRFLAYQMQSHYGRQYFLSCAKQTTNLASINSSQLKEFPVLFPRYEEQNKIVDLLSTWDITIEKAEKLIEAKEERFSWLLGRLISSDKYPRGHVRDFTTEVSERNSGGAIERVLSVTNNRGFVLPEDQFERRVASSDLSNYKVVTRGQYAYNPSRINVGSVARMDDWDKGVLSPMYVVFEVNDKKVNSDFFLHWLSSHAAKERIRKSAQGSVRETVSFADLGAIPFPLPSLEQQQQVAETLNAARQEIDLLKKQADAYRKQKRGLMQKLLTSKWRVGVD